VLTENLTNQPGHGLDPGICEQFLQGQVLTDQRLNNHPLTKPAQA